MNKDKKPPKPGIKTLQKPSVLKKPQKIWRNDASNTPTNRIVTRVTRRLKRRLFIKDKI
jgi:hypothetical protein